MEREFDVGLIEDYGLVDFNRYAYLCRVTGKTIDGCDLYCAGWKIFIDADGSMFDISFGGDND